MAKKSIKTKFYGKQKKKKKFAKLSQIPEIIVMHTAVTLVCCSR